MRLEAIHLTSVLIKGGHGVVKTGLLDLRSLKFTHTNQQEAKNMITAIRSETSDCLGTILDQDFISGCNK